MERLDKLIASGGRYTRKEAKKLIQSKRIAVSGQTVTDPAYKAEPETVTLDGSPFLSEPLVYIMMHKPQGVISASRDRNAKTAIDLVPEPLRRNGLFPAGRLDQDTTGFLLITNDGVFAHEILSPKKHIPKTYLVTLDKPFTHSLHAAFKLGVVLGDGTVCKPAEFTPLGERQAQVVLHEGKYHQIKRMFAVYGYTVTALERTKMGGLALDPALKPGECRLITPDEMHKIL